MDVIVPSPTICNQLLFFPNHLLPSNSIPSTKQNVLWSHQLFNGVCGGSANDHHFHNRASHCLPAWTLPPIWSLQLLHVWQPIVYPNHQQFLHLQNTFEVCSCARGKWHHPWFRLDVCNWCYPLQWWFWNTQPFAVCHCIAARRSLLESQWRWAHYIILWYDSLMIYCRQILFQWSLHLLLMAWILKTCSWTNLMWSCT